MSNLTQLLAVYAVFASIFQISLLGFVWCDATSRGLARGRWMALVLVTGPVGTIAYLAVNPASRGGFTVRLTEYPAPRKVPGKHLEDAVGCGSRQGLRAGYRGGLARQGFLGS